MNKNSFIGIIPLGNGTLYKPKANLNFTYLPYRIHYLKIKD